MTNSLFLDASYAIALAAPSDQHHRRAVELARQVEARSARLVTTRAVVLEIGNALSKPAHRDAAVALLRSLEQDATVEVLPLTNALYNGGLDAVPAPAG